MERNESFSIRQMIELTGLSEFTIRGWENRYSAFDPRRSATGRREYSKSDVERALLIRELLKRGHRIGKVAALSNQKLQNLFENDESKSNTAKSLSNSKLVIQAMDFMALQKWEELERLIKSVKCKNTTELVHDFILPLLHMLAVHVEKGIVSVSQEHIVSSFVKEKIYSALSELSTKKKNRRSVSKARFVLATPEGDHHEIGLLLAHLLTRSYGFTSLYLGPHSPAKDLAETALRFHASHILIVSTVSIEGGARHSILSYVSTLQKGIAEHCKIWIAGAQMPILDPDSNSSLLSISSFQVFEKWLRQIGGKQ